MNIIITVVLGLFLIFFLYEVISYYVIKGFYEKDAENLKVVKDLVKSNLLSNDKMNIDFVDGCIEKLVKKRNSFIAKLLIREDLVNYYYLVVLNEIREELI